MGQTFLPPESRLALIEGIVDRSAGKTGSFSLSHWVLWEVGKSELISLGQTYTVQ